LQEVQQQHDQVCLWNICQQSHR